MAQGWKEKLVSGYRKFKSNNYPLMQDDFAETSKNGQKPEVLLIACSDSRANPSVIFGASPGDIFVLRNIANLVPKSGENTSVASALEFAVKVLKVKAIVVMGHEQCGGVAAYIDGLDKGSGLDNVAQWISHLRGTKPHDCPNISNDISDNLAMELGGVRNSLDNLLSYDFISEAVSENSLDLAGGYFAIASARLYLTDENGEFQKI